MPPNLRPFLSDLFRIGKAKRALHDIWMAETRKDAHAAFDAFIESYGRKYGPLIFRQEAAFDASLVPLAAAAYRASGLVLCRVARGTFTPRRSQNRA